MPFIRRPTESQADRKIRDDGRWEIKDGPTYMVGCGADETERDDQEIIVVFQARFPGDAGPPASDASSCENTPRDSDWQGG